MEKRVNNIVYYENLSHKLYFKEVTKMKEGIKFGMGCTIGICLAIFALGALSGAQEVLSENKNNKEKGGEEES